MEAIIWDFLTQVYHVPLWLGYLFFFASSVLQITFPPYPGDTVLVFGGALSSGGLSEWNIPVFLSYWLGTIFSSYGLYELGAWKGEALLQVPFVSKYFPETQQDKAKAWIRKYGILVFFICKFIPGLNSVLIIFGGIFRYKKSWAYLGIGISAFLHNLIFFIAGKFIGRKWEGITRFLTIYNKIVIVIVIAAALGVLVYGYIKRSSLRGS